jgi:hypothetical protein
LTTLLGVVLDVGCAAGTFEPELVLELVPATGRVVDRGEGGARSRVLGAARLVGFVVDGGRIPELEGVFLGVLVVVGTLDMLKPVLLSRA